jgi:hypothetical protein
MKCGSSLDSSSAFAAAIVGEVSGVSWTMIFSNLSSRGPSCQPMLQAYRMVWCEGWAPHFGQLYTRTCTHSDHTGIDGLYITRAPQYAHDERGTQCRDSITTSEEWKRKRKRKRKNSEDWPLLSPHTPELLDQLWPMAQYAMWEEEREGEEDEEVEDEERRRR